MKKWIVIGAIILLSISGCSGTGFDKRTTLMPDRIGISVSQQEYQSEPRAWQGITFSAQWDLK